MRRISAAEASHNFMGLLDNVEHRHVAYVIERDGRSVAEVCPRRAASTIGDLRALLREPAPDPAWANDIQVEIAARKALPVRDRWSSA